MPGVTPKDEIRGLFLDFADTVAYLWVPKVKRFAYLCDQSGLGDLDPIRLTDGTRAFLLADDTVDPHPEGPLGWRGSLSAYRAGLDAMEVPQSSTWAARLHGVALGLPADMHLQPGARELLMRARKEGLQVAIVSNHHGKLKDNLASVGLTDLVDLPVDSQLVGVRKPDPEIFRIACRGLDLEPASCAHVGDVPEADIRGANDAGLRAVLLDPFGLYRPGDGGLKFVSARTLHDAGHLLGI